MNFRNFLKKRNLSRDISRLLIIIFLIIVCIFVLKAPELFGQKYSSFFLIVITAVYAYLTYEILRSTKVNRSLPSLSIEYLFVSKLDSDILNDYKRYIDPTEIFLQLQKTCQGSSIRKDFIFVKFENLGDGAALDIELNIKYNKNNRGDEGSVSKKVKFKDLKSEEISLQLLESYDDPTQDDYFEMRECYVMFNDIGRRYSKDKPIKWDFSEKAASRRDNNSLVFFKGS